MSIIAPLITETMGAIGGTIAQNAGMTAAQYAGVMGTAAAGMGSINSNSGNRDFYESFIRGTHMDDNYNRRRQGIGAYIPQIQQSQRRQQTSTEEFLNSGIFGIDQSMAKMPKIVDKKTRRGAQIYDMEDFLPMDLPREQRQEDNQIDSSQINPIWKRNQEELQKQKDQQTRDIINQSNKNGKVPKIKLPKSKTDEIKKIKEEDNFIKNPQGLQEFPPAEDFVEKDKQPKKSKKQANNNGDNPDNGGDYPGNDKGGNDKPKKEKGPPRMPQIPNIPLPQNNNNNIVKDQQEDTPKDNPEEQNNNNTEIIDYLQKIDYELEKLSDQQFNQITNYFINNDIKNNKNSRLDPDSVISSILETL